MRTSALLLAFSIAACSKGDAAKNTPAPASGSGSASASAQPEMSKPAPKPAPPPPPAAATKLELTMWTSLDGASAKTIPLQGPFASLDAACKAIKQPTPDGGCDHSPPDPAPALAAPFLEIADLKSTNPDDATTDPQAAESAHWPVVSEAIRTSTGWYVVTGLCYSANYTECGLHTSMVGNRLVIAYESNEANEGRWGGDVETGLVACAATDAGAVACTPKIALTSTTSTTEDRDDPGGKVDVHYACAGELHPDGHLVVGDLPKTDEQAKTAPKGACAKLAYAGDHTVAF